MTAGGAAGPAPIPLTVLRDREALREDIIKRRAGEPRRHKAISEASRAFLMGVLATQPDLVGAPATLLESFLQGKAGGTWDRYVGVIRPWVEHAERAGLPALPAPPVPFACWLATVGEQGRGQHGYSQTKTRCVAIDGLSALVGQPSPTGHRAVKAYRAMARRTKRYRRGRARPLLGHEIPIVAPPGSASPPSPALPPGAAGVQGRGRPSALSPRTARRAHTATAGMLAVMHDAGLRYDDGREGQLGDMLFFPDAVDVGIFGSKTDPLLVGQTAQMPNGADAPFDRATGAQAIVEVIRQGLERLHALPADTLGPMATRLCQTFPEDSGTESAMATWPDAVRALAAPLYARGLLVHCLPYYGSWLWAPLTADTDLAATLSTGEFIRMMRRTLAAAGVPTAGMTAHSARRGAAAMLTHGGMPLPTLSRVLRHTDGRSTEPYIFQSVLVTETAAAIRDAARRSSGPPPPGVPPPRPAGTAYAPRGGGGAGRGARRSA